MSKPGPTDTDERVLAYMRLQNRPYSAQNVFDNLRGEVPKSKVGAALDAGVLSDTLVVKNYGAQKVYCVRQQTGAPAPGADDSVNSNDMRATIASIQDRVAALSVEFEDSRARLSRLNQRRSLLERREHFTNRLSHMQSQMSNMHAERSRVHKRKQPAATLSSEQLSEYVDQYQDEYRKRKRIGVELLHYVSEACNSSRDEIMEELGLETDDNFQPQRGA